MIVFDLRCPAEHVFEIWFGSTDDYEKQKARGLVQCPFCGSAEVEKAVMAPRVGPKGNQLSETPRQAMVASPPQPPIAPEALKAMLQAAAEAQSRMLEKMDYVGDRFAREARDIHLGDSEQRPIYGQASPTEVKSLIEDGIDVSPLPFPVRPPGMDN
ncbi:DUF1178 family protein [Flavisphingomonas formosensis]|uniref:DUF1178 family protein n=1 Tax=Flavisphingomonas formosensis TaxID=861534 RepID=UPI0012FA2468|nr:DUF1178 family protein [Sphingomonas formosensis]